MMENFIPKDCERKVLVPGLGASMDGWAGPEFLLDVSCFSLRMENEETRLMVIFGAPP